MTRAKSATFFLQISAVLASIHLSIGANEPAFRFDGIRPADTTTPTVTSSDFATPNSSLVWQPLRATFRPLNRQSTPQPPSPPQPPAPPAPPAPPEPLALVSSEFDSDRFSSSPGAGFSSTGAGFASSSSAASAALFATTTQSPPTFTSSPASISLDDEDQPTRVPLNRFRPTKAPSVDAQAQPSSGGLFAAGGSHSQANSSRNFQRPYKISNECFECICEASTSCNVNSRCQTSDVRHTRCGMFLVSYDQWLDTNLSRELVTREALARDPAADERAFYECVTNRDCAERLVSIYMQKNERDCDKDGRIDCYDVAAIHQGGTDNCNSESLLESQYWSDFNACFGFGRRRRR